MISKAMVLAGAALCVYLGFVLLIYITQSRMVYFPSRSIDATPAHIGLDYRDAWIAASDGTRIHGWYVPEQNARFTILMLHGNAGNISHRLRTLEMLHKIGVNTLIIDYRGYGRSEGQPSELGTYRDAMAAWEYLLAIETDAASVILFGRSLGGAVAAWLAAQVNPGGLILDSTFTSVNDMAQHHYPVLPVRYISKFKYDSQALAGRIQSPTLVMHSRQDDIVPFDQGQKLYDALPGRKSFLEMQGGHNGGLHHNGDAYTNGLRNFISTL